MKSLFKKIVVYILTLEARFVLWRHKPSVVAVTGSVGKTSAKDAIFTVLSSMYHTRKSQKSFNSEIGVPLTILGLDNAWSNPLLWLKNILLGLGVALFKTKYPKCLVLEVGADHPGDIESLSKWLKTDVVVIMKVSDVPVHVEFFQSAEAVLAEKACLIDSLKKDGTLVLYGDDKKVRELAIGLPRKIINFGIQNNSQNNDVTASNYNVAYAERDGSRVPTGFSFKLNYAGNSLPVNISGVIGVTQMYSLLAAASVGIARGVVLTSIGVALSEHSFPPGRMNLIDGISGSVLIDDTYNSSPDAVREALNTLAGINGATGEHGGSWRKIAILGDMMELGSFSSSEHKDVIELALKTCDIVYTVGPRMRAASNSAESFGDAVSLGEFVAKTLIKGDLVLIKGSQSMRMEKTTKILMEQPERASELLVRQDKEWLAKQ